MFATARTSFAWLVTGPDPVSVDGREIAGLPPRPVPLDELGTLLLAEDCTQATHDATWAHLITRARIERGRWMVACVGLALPLLLRAAAKVKRRFRGDPHDLNVAVLTGFLAELHETDLARPAVLGRLYYTAYREGLLALHEAAGGPLPVDNPELHLELDPKSAVAPLLTLGHPDLVLAEAVDAEVITTEEAGLISETRVGDTPLAEATRARGLSYKPAAKIRKRAETHLAAYLTEEPDDTPARAPVERPVLPATARAHRVARTHQPGETTRTGRAGLHKVATAEVAPETTATRSGQLHGPESGITSRGSRSPADRRSPAGLTHSGSVARIPREARSCD
ncbi:sigma-70 family RNA polymerase sigma factor [Amycolatopsis sp. CA-230715]|uniref:sigma-70 family RNA polymerase sigma factor n=1 Tax=Amycolatopsis sp. CA-230715 TaxID=2745196 RepID=UPI0020B3B9DA|nr:sigma-70 family RNA polymerase sigma factor [Amycolatopsis sp. CA-230715]